MFENTLLEDQMVLERFENTVCHGARLMVLQSIAVNATAKV